ncbi:MAG TPA: hypothetical protein VFG73_10980 [Rhodanobacteraceae bacterium]|nr:hypothetical protein [Rhodanobacteraceae bacterium]
MSMLTLFHLGGRWLALDGARLVPLDEYPTLDLPTLVISDFDHALTGVMSLEASPRMAAPLVERRLRDEGLVEGETRLEISELVRVGKGFQALYSAVPMGDWQRMIGWANGNRDHCLVVPLLSVAKRLLQPGQAVVLRHGNQVTYLAVDRDAVQHAETLAYSDDTDGVLGSITALADRVRALLVNGHAPRKVIWYGLDVRPGQDDTAYATLFGQALKLEVQMAAHHALRLDDGETVQSAIPEIARAARIGDAASPQLSGALIHAERWLPLAAAAAAVAALGLLLFAWRVDSHAKDKLAQAAQLQAEASRAVAAASAPDMDELRHTRDFVKRLAAAADGQDMSVALAKVRQSAQAWVHVLRLRMDERTHQIFVEGAIDHGPDGAKHLGMFIANLRTAGFQPLAVDPPLGTRSADYFSYALQPAASAPVAYALQASAQGAPGRSP